MGKFGEYVDFLLTRGLRVENLMKRDWILSISFVEKCGLLPADTVHLAVAVRLGSTA